MTADNFTEVPLTASNLDRYYVRSSILDAINASLVNFKGSFLDIGCGKMPYKDFILQNTAVEQYVGLDIETALLYDAAVQPDHTWDGVTMPFEAYRFHTAFATEVLEHCPEPLVTLKEVHRVLKEGGCFFFTVPFLWNLHEVPHDEYRYTPFALQRLLEQAGFTNIEIKATGGWHAAMAQMLGLWVRRAPMPAGKRKLLGRFLKPVIKKLVKLDQFSSISFTEGQMITGLYGTAFKK